ncbi:uncharacterized protein PHALS_11462 [Plasmopara halstedii]|uniref:Uncharacterized protein n=1 Tax=Plasmopara halstedii TaxID=4781 RepID=A0A0P1A5F3_PLAHL|nr:uncharacterized protein PHALS_11462 [Plasmopara halstedii]CEG35591.1 hypothetical protein PHALS_11462 [Plasmopara halstedii]|eukprot:XP_024571960.1 hypothetical protein PHALS_11462 [Plasmopara halstedii]
MDIGDKQISNSFVSQTYTITLIRTEMGYVPRYIDFFHIALTSTVQLARGDIYVLRKISEDTHQ